MSPEPMKPRVVRVPDDLWQDALARAEQRGETLSEEIRDFLRRYVTKAHVIHRLDLSENQEYLKVEKTVPGKIAGTVPEFRAVRDEIVESLLGQASELGWSVEESDIHFDQDDYRRVLGGDLAKSEVTATLYRPTD